MKQNKISMRPSQGCITKDIKNLKKYIKKYIFTKNSTYLLTFFAK